VLPVAVAIDLLAVVLLLGVLRPINVRRAIAYDLYERWPEYEKDYGDKAEQEWTLLLESWGALIYKDRHAGEELSEYGRRLLGERRWERVKPPNLKG
jgi:hypothetical protein